MKSKNTAPEQDLTNEQQIKKLLTTPAWRSFFGIPRKKFTPEELENLNELLSKVTTLNLDNSKMGFSVAKVLAAAMKDNNTITHLSLRNNYIYDGGVEEFATMLKTNSTLKSLDLGMNSIRHKGADSLSKALKTNTTLDCLDLSNNGISSEGAISLAEMLKDNSNLKSLNISSNYITGEGGNQYNYMFSPIVSKLVEALKENTSLTTFHLADNSFFDTEVVTLIDAIEANKTIEHCNVCEFGYGHIMEGNDDPSPPYWFRNKTSSVTEDRMAAVLKENRDKQKLKLSKEPNNTIAKSPQTTSEKAPNTKSPNPELPRARRSSSSLQLPQLTNLPTNNTSFRS